MKVWVEDVSAGGVKHYVVWVDGEIYSSFTSTKRLTHSELIDVEAGYREGLGG